MAFLSSGLSAEGAGEHGGEKRSGDGHARLEWSPRFVSASEQGGDIGPTF